MVKDPEFHIRLTDLDSALLESNPDFRMDILRVVMTFKLLSDQQLEDMREYADADSGKIERWLIVPSTMPLSVLGVTIDKAFGLIPSLQSSFFSLPDDRFKFYVPDFRTFLDDCGALFFNPIDDDYTMGVSYASSLSQNEIMEYPYHLEHISYKEAQESLSDIRMLLDSTAFSNDGRRLGDLPVTADLIEKLTHKIARPLVTDLSLFIPYPYVLGREGSPSAPVEQVRKIIRKTGFRCIERKRNVKALSHELIYTKLPIEGDEKGFEFTITRPRDAREIFEDGYNDIKGYLDSIRYVSCNRAPDCIAKMGYDIFGETEEEYHSFIMRIHSSEAVIYRQLGAEAGWREPYMDKRRVLR